MFPDQLTESISAALRLRNSGKTVVGEGEYPIETLCNAVNQTNSEAFVSEIVPVEQAKDKL
jgi:hypothetical protein